MGDCKEIFAMLSEYLDGDLKPETCEDIRRHIAACPPCIEFVESLKKTVALCHECQPQAAPPPLNEEVRERLRKCYQQALASRSSQA